MTVSAVPRRVDAQCTANSSAYVATGKALGTLFARSYRGRGEPA